MSNDKNKMELVQFRLTSDQLDLLKKAHRNYMEENESTTTQAEYLRQIVMIACLRQVGLINLSEKPKVVYDCPCIEVHTCGKK